MVSIRSSTIQCQYQVIYSNCQYSHTHTTHMQKADLSDNCCQPSLAHTPMDSDHFRNRKLHPELDNGTAWYNPHQKGMVDNLKKPRRAIRPNKQNARAYRYSSIWQSNSGVAPKSQAHQPTDAGLIPQCSKVIFLPVSYWCRLSYSVRTAPVCNYMLQHRCAGSKSQPLAAIPPSGHTKILHLLV